MRSAFLFCTVAVAVWAQRPFSGAAETKQALEKLTVVGSAMMIAAHPDDENTAVIAYLARGRKVRTAYLSLNRGEGGQNLIGSEQSVEIGLIRTQELLAARKIDGGEQFFTRVIDFGFSKTPAETIAKWGKEAVLADVVYNIRRFKPDVIINRFSGTPRDGHGHHTTSALLSKEAFEAAGDPKRFPEQLQYVEVWKPKRLVWNVFAFTRQQEQEAEKLANRVPIDTGVYDPLLGYSYSEIAGLSRSQHRSQAMGSPERKGSQVNYMVHVAGEAASKDLFDGIDLTWKRVPGGEAIGVLLEKAAREFRPDAPEAVLPHLAKARGMLARNNDHYSQLKLKELDEAIAMCAGLWVELQSAYAQAVQGLETKVRVAAIQRGKTPVQVSSVVFDRAQELAPVKTPFALPSNQPVNQEVAWKIPVDAELTQPYFLKEPRTDARFTVKDWRMVGLPESPAPLKATLRVDVGGTEIVLERGLVHRYVDRSTGELVKPFLIVPPVSVNVEQEALLFPMVSARKVDVIVRSNQVGVAGKLRLDLPEGWNAEPREQDFQIEAAGENLALSFSVRAPEGESAGQLRAVAVVNGREYSHGTRTIEYPHIPPQTWAPPAVAKLVKTTVKNLSKKIGYVMGAGDEVPEALRQLGCEVTLLSANDLSAGNLSQYDAIVTGVRAYNVRPDLRANVQRILDGYVAKGGTYIVQYNVVEGGPFGPADPTLLAKVGPYPITVSRDRVTDETAAITFPKEDHRLLQFPNQITAKDFAGWVQERGLYFASKWDERYQPLFTANDPGEKPTSGGTLVTNYGQGTYIFTPMAWFRQLPAGVPGAYRIFANFLSAGKSE
ncbi:MAG: PIG-L family deacetylase [Bryobacter sp.]|nr:PIG-L family deacetylase [Bryobacter sp.]